MRHADFDEIYRTNVQQLYRYCLFRTNSREQAEDLTAEVFVRYLQNSTKVFGPRVVPWLFRVAHNLCADSRAREVMHAKAVGALDVRVAEEPAWIDPSVWRAMRKLPAEQQQALFFKAVEDLTFKQIAKLTGRTQSAVKMSYYRGAQALAAELREHR
ncbi:MAG: sigma-70 family RNA polymerase sigma factor [Coriobacteriales bacterium]|nr:sigma-70 family RNA polymerase sigma factor [Coriobacteriales bacterium]